MKKEILFLSVLGVFLSIPALADGRATKQSLGQSEGEEVCELAPRQSSGGSAVKNESSAASGIVMTESNQNLSQSHGASGN